MEVVTSEASAVGQLQRQLEERVEANRRLHELLCQHDIHMEMPLVDRELISTDVAAIKLDEATLRRRLKHASEVQQYHSQRMQKKMRSLEFDLKAAQRQRQELEQLASNDYKFMRNQWMHYRDCEDLDLDDRIDKLSKVVAMIRGKVSRRIEKERAVEVDEKERQELRQQCLAELQQKLQRSERERSLLETKLAESDAVVNKARSDNQTLLAELKRTKQRLKAIEVQYVQVCKREQELSEKFLRNQNEVKKSKLTYQGKDFIVQILKDGLPKLQKMTHKDLHHIRDFLEGSHDENRFSLQNLPTIPKLNFEKRQSVATEGDESITTTDQSQEPVRRTGQMKQLGYMRINRNTKTDRLQLHESMSQRSFYTKLHNIEDILIKR